MIFDLEDWDVISGFGSVFGIVCPWCEKQLGRIEDARTGFMTCPDCVKPFVWRAGNTPLGFAWQTYRKGDRP